MSFMRAPAPPAAMPGPASHRLPAMPPTRVHFGDLDFLRGIAAIMVMLFHFGERTGLPGLVAHGYLAVDLFFVMSAFVLSHAYGPALCEGRIGVMRFTVLRVARFWPMLVLGTVLAAVIELGRPGGLSSLHLRETLVSLLAGCAFVPVFHTVTVEHVLFPLNGPVWSLFFELIGNIAFAVLVAVRVPRGAGLLLALVSAMWLGSFLGANGSVEYAGTVAQDFLAGFPRVALAMCIGVALHRLDVPHLRLDRWVLALVVIGFTCMPSLPGLAEPLYNAACLLLVCPAIVLLATSHAPTQRAPALVRWSGMISYPLYAIHYPIARAIGFLLMHHTLSPALRLAAVLASAAAIVALAAGCEVAYDAPLRRRLRRLVLA